MSYSILVFLTLCIVVKSQYGFGPYGPAMSMFGGPYGRSPYFSPRGSMMPFYPSFGSYGSGSSRRSTYANPFMSPMGMPPLSSFYGGFGSGIGGSFGPGIGGGFGPSFSSPFMPASPFSSPSLPPPMPGFGGGYGSFGSSSRPTFQVTKLDGKTVG